VSWATFAAFMPRLIPPVLLSLLASEPVEHKRILMSPRRAAARAEARGEKRAERQRPEGCG